MNPNSPRDFAAALASLSELIVASGDSKAGNLVRTLGDLFAGSPEKTTAATLKKLQTIPIVQSDSSDSTVGVQRFLMTGAKFASRVGGTKFADHCEALTTLLKRHNKASLMEFVATANTHLHTPKPTKAAKIVRADVVETYTERLQADLGSDRFVQTVAELAADRSLSSQEVEAISKSFTSIKSKGRPKSLQAILNRHNSMMGFHEKTLSRAGRSAA